MQSISNNNNTSKQDDNHKTIDELGLTGKIIFESGLSDEQMRDAYRSATIYICPSRYEGFGLPVVEAMQCGCPVICSDRGSLPEVTGTAGILITELDNVDFCTEQLTVTMNSILNQQIKRKSFIIHHKKD